MTEILKQEHELTYLDGSEFKVVLAATVTPAQAMRMKCLDCSNGSRKEVAECVVDDCPLFPFRHGSRPQYAGNVRSKRELTDSQREKLTAQLKRGREAQKRSALENAGQRQGVAANSGPAAGGGR
jgi:hypothetical protein